MAIMARKKSTPAGARKKVPSPPAPTPPRAIVARARRWVLRGVLGVLGALLALVLLLSVINPPTTLTILSESQRLGGVQRKWVPIEKIAPVMARSVVAAEDANFCLHWGFDMAEIRRAIDTGSNRGASTLSQQVVKNVFLWQGRSWARKALEATITPLVETVWTKRRILEVYLNIAEFDTGVFGIHAAAEHHFGVTPDKLTPRQAALLAAVLPDPKGRNAVRPSKFTDKRANAIQDGAETIRRDGRARCFAP